jgi:hypothetical protein
VGEAFKNKFTAALMYANNEKGLAREEEVTGGMTI